MLAIGLERISWLHFTVRSRPPEAVLSQTELWLNMGPLAGHLLNVSCYIHARSSIPCYNVTFVYPRAQGTRQNETVEPWCGSWSMYKPWGGIWTANNQQEYIELRKYKWVSTTGNK